MKKNTSLAVVAAQSSKKGMRAAFGLIEIVLVIILVGAILAGVYSKFGKTKTGGDARIGAEKVTTVIAAIEAAKQTNGQTYVVENQLLSSTRAGIKKITNNMGGTTNSKDVADWRYSCPVGARQTLTITTTPFESAEIAALVVDNVNSNNYPWTAALSAGNAVVVRLANITCR